MKTLLMAILCFTSLSVLAGYINPFVPLALYDCTATVDPDTGGAISKVSMISHAEKTGFKMINVDFSTKSNKKLILKGLSEKGKWIKIAVNFPSFAKAKSFKSYLETQAMSKVAIPVDSCGSTEKDFKKLSMKTESDNFLFLLEK